MRESTADLRPGILPLCRPSMKSSACIRMASSNAQLDARVDGHPMGGVGGAGEAQVQPGERGMAAKEPDLEVDESMQPQQRSRVVSSIERFGHPRHELRAPAQPDLPEKVFLAGKNK